ncbi:MAG TPA: PilZ domain-containing protein [Sphingomonas sp.]
MRMAATITILERSPRRSVTLPGTVRVDGAPIDIEILNLSTSGFLALSRVPLELGSEVCVGWTAGGRHEAVVIRADAGEYGFAFQRELPATAVASAMALDNIVLIERETSQLEAPMAKPELADTPPSVERWSVRNRLLFISGSAVAAWSVIGLIVWTII